MTNLAKPKKTRLGTPPQAKESKVTTNLKQKPSGSLVRFNMHMSPEQKKELKLLAAENGLTMTEIIFEGIELWKAKYA